MARYIELDKCDQYRTNHGGYPDTFAFPPWTEFEDVAPVIHAHWLKDDNNQCYCSACMDDHYRPMFFTPHPQWRYCPWCGAKMDEEVKE